MGPLEHEAPSSVPGVIWIARFLEYGPVNRGMPENNEEKSKSVTPPDAFTDDQEGTLQTLMSFSIVFDVSCR